MTTKIEIIFKKLINNFEFKLLFLKLQKISAKNLSF